MKIFSKGLKGFTLIELLVVVVIIALLVLIAIVAVTRYIPRANDARRKSDIKRMKIAIEEYEKDNNCYPLPSTMRTCGSASDIAIHPYLFNVPCDPLYKEPYYYETDGNVCAKWYRLYAKLQNEQDADYMAGIGDGGSYSYYDDSDNAPPLIYCMPMYGCFSGKCLPVTVSWIDNKCTPSCFPAYTTDVCNSPGNCGTPSDPLNECE